MFYIVPDGGEEKTNWWVNYSSIDNKSIFQVEAEINLSACLTSHQTLSSPSFVSKVK